MKTVFYFAVISGIFLFSCSPTKRVINNAIAPKDTTNVIRDQTSKEAIQLAQITRENLKKNYIDFKTFSAKIKVESQDSKGKNPDITAVVRIVKDSAIWISLSATFLNVEVYRALITKDSVVLMDKREKTVQYRSLDYLQEVTKIPFDFKTLQDLLIGNPIFYNDQSATFKKVDNYILVNSADANFKNLMTLTPDNSLLYRIKLDDVDMARNRTANISYDEYERSNDISFSTYREISISEKNKLDVQMKYKQFDFNKELSVGFSIPKNYKRK